MISPLKTTLAIVFVAAALGSIAKGEAPSREFATMLPPKTLLMFEWSPADSEETYLSNMIRAVSAVSTGDERYPDAQRMIQSALNFVADMCSKPGGVALVDLSMTNETPAVHAVLVVAAGDDAQKMSDAIVPMMEGIACNPETEAATVAGVNFRTVPLGDSPVSLMWAAHEGRLLVATSETSAKALVEQIKKGDAGSLAKDESYALGVRKCSGASDGSVTERFFLNVAEAVRVGRDAAIASGAAAADFDRIAKALGAAQFRSIYAQAAVGQGGRGISRSFLHAPGKPVGLMKLWEQKPLTQDDLKIIPQDAYWASVGKLDLAKLWADAMEAVTEIEPDAAAGIEGALAAAAPMLGFSIVDGLLPALGDTWAIWDGASHGSLLFTGAVIGVKTNKPDEVQGILEGVWTRVAAIARGSDVTFETMKAKIGRHDVTYLVLGGVPAPVSPAWGFVGDWMVIGLFPQTVAAAMNEVDPATRKGSVLDHPEWAAAKAQLAEKPLSFSYCDSKEAMRFFYPIYLMYTTAISSMGSNTPLALDPAAYPTLVDVLATTHAAFGTSTVDGDGVLYSSVGSDVMLLPAVSAGALATSILLPSLSRARELAKRSVSASNLRGIGQGLHIYANDNTEKFPPSLQTLIDQGMATKEMLISPRQAGDEPSYVYIAGQTTSSNLRNLLAYEIFVDDEGTNALYVDGHVMFLKRAEFVREIQATYKRLKREDELPAEFRE